MKRKILFVGMSDSPHMARWINLIADQGWDLHIFPVHNYCGAYHPLLSEVTIHEPWKEVEGSWFIKFLVRKFGHEFNDRSKSFKVRMSYIFPLLIPKKIAKKIYKIKTRPLGESDVCLSLPYGPYVLARLIKQLKPDLIHSMEFQHAGYNVLKAKEIIGKKKFPKWIATNWGSDIFYYRQFADHKKQIKRLLSNIDYYSCECERDLQLAREMGLTGKPMPVFPNTGGFNLAEISELRKLNPPSARRLIMVKGYQHFAGRALNALKALKLCARELKDYHIVMFSTSPEIYSFIEEARILYNLNISILGYTDHSKILRFLSHARIYLGVSISDAISTSMIEAMAVGVFPIQTHTSCCEEWIEDGVSGFSIPPDNIELIAERIKTALKNDVLVDEAAEINMQTVSARLDERILKEKQIAFYDQIFSDMGGASLVSEVPLLQIPKALVINELQS